MKQHILYCTSKIIVSINQIAEYNHITLTEIPKELKEQQTKL